MAFDKAERMRDALKEAVSLVQTALDEITFYDRELKDMLETDDGPIDILLDEVICLMRRKIRELKP